MEYIIEHREERNIFFTEVEGHIAYVQYSCNIDSLDIFHTSVPPEIAGRGVAAALVKKTYEYAAELGLKPLASCSYAARWLERHPEMK